MARQPVVYILASPSGRALYIGVTTDMGRRLEEHRRGLSEHTSRYNITKLVYLESHETAPNAIEREKQLKRWRREKKIALIESANPEWLDLSNEVF
ncbi:MAG: GIY-YIG nuclease family protein [Rhodospirillales bacterium]|nr:GIY-YIG nuclease family protein [Rhodospirillales bacterium]